MRDDGQHPTRHLPGIPDYPLRPPTVARATIGPNSVAVTNDGTHNVFVAVMWDQGIWRYVEP